MIELDGSSLTIDQLLAIADDYETVALAAAARERVQASRAVVERRAGGDEPAYGINTGFGSFAEVKISPDALETASAQPAAQPRRRPGRSAAGPHRPRHDRAAGERAGQGVLRHQRRDAGRAARARQRAACIPSCPSRGSVGASGDLAPLAHLALVLIGEGRTLDGVDGAEALQRAGLTPTRLGPKEGLALINGTQPSTAVLALAVDAADRVARAADIAAALSIDALRGSIHPFEARIHDAAAVRGPADLGRQHREPDARQRHQQVARALRQGQDAYSLRCAAQVHGATREALRFVRETVTIEANSATDNPMVFADTGDIVSGGNFHGAPIAIAADLLAAAIVPLATISERRTDRLVDPVLSGLPAFLTREGGLRSGLMLVQVTAAAIASELKTLAHPAGVDTIPTSANREDHVSMSMTAALKAERAVARAREVVAIEILCACQAIDLLAPLVTSPALANVHAVGAIARADARQRPIVIVGYRRDRRTDRVARVDDVCDGRVK